MAINLLELSVELAKAHLSQNQMPYADVPQFIRSIHDTLLELQDAKPHAESDQDALTSIESANGQLAAVAENESITYGASPKIAAIRNENIDDPAFKGLDPWLAMRISPNLARKLDPQNKVHPTVYNDKIICLEDGSEVKLLRAYVRKNFGLQFHEYLAKWNLPNNYPTAPSAYIENKRRLAKQSGLGVTTRAIREKKPKIVKVVDAAAVSG